MCAQTIAREDYPYNWPGIMDQIHTTLSTESQASAWLGSLLVLHQVLQAMGLSSNGYSVGILGVFRVFLKLFGVHFNSYNIISLNSKIMGANII